MPAGDIYHRRFNERLLSCIDMAYGVPVIFLAYALLAMYFCGLFKSGKVWVRDVGYVIFLVAFVLFIMLLRRYINSGFYAIVNEFLDHVTDYYGAQEVKVFSETLSNRALTVPVAAIAIGCVEIIILNIFLNTNMSVFWAVWFSLPVFILPLFSGLSRMLFTCSWYPQDFWELSALREMVTSV